MSTQKLIPFRPQRVHPATVAVAKKRAESVQLRIADAITAFAGSMPFVYIHALVFVIWMVFLEKSPWPTLTLIVSLEAIFLSTFVMIGQNRQASFQQAKDNHDFQVSEKELHENTDLTKAIHQLTAKSTPAWSPNSRRHHRRSDGTHTSPNSGIDVDFDRHGRRVDVDLHARR